MKRLGLGISAAVLALAGTAFGVAVAQDHPANETRAEAQTRAEHLFDKLDRNHDGKLDQADRVARINEMFDRIDTNHDGAISRDEFIAMHEHMGHDGEHAGPDHHGPDHHGMAGDHDMPGGMPGEPDMRGEAGGGRMGHWGYGHRELAGLVMLILRRADPNHTGTVNRDAFVHGALALFDEADTNHDGILTPEEHRAAAMAMRQQMRAKWMEHRDGGPMAGDMPPAAH